jgi:thiamine-monophosphate kinase
VTCPRKDEAAWLRLLGELFGPSGAPVDRGDDGCVLELGRWCLSTDALLEHVDFELTWAPPEAVGHKALAAGLSDLAAMGARPRYFLLTLGWPEEVGEEVVEGVLRGMAALAREEAVGLCGGDLTRSPAGLLLSLTVVGEQAATPLRRSGGRAGDFLFVSDFLGAPRWALEKMKAQARLVSFAPGAPPPSEEAALLDRFFRPPSQGALGVFLAQSGVASCCMDLSDGLQRDLSRLCEASGCGAVVEAEQVPVDPLLSALPPQEALSYALEGGEEQTLLFAVAPDKVSVLQRAPFAVHRIGRLMEERALILAGPGGRIRPLPDHGFDHFVA